MELTLENLQEAIRDTVSTEIGKLKETDKKGIHEDVPVTDMIAPEDKIMSDPKGGFKNVAHFFKDVILDGTPNARVSEAGKAYKIACRKTAGTMEEGDLSQGGFTVPEEFAEKILEKDLEAAIVRPRASIQPMKSNRIVIPADYDSDHSSNYFGGITIYRTAEGAQHSGTNPVVGQIALTLHQLTGLCYATAELMEDSVIAVEAFIERKFRQAISFVEDDDFLTGDGSNKALGAFNASNPSLISVSRQEASNIIYDDIVNMWSQLYPRCQRNAVWVAHIDTFPYLAKMDLAVGTGGAAAWMPAGGLSGSPFQSLMGRPLLYTEKCSTTGTAGDLCLADFSQYLIGQKSGGVSMASSIHLRFDYNETVFRFNMRYDGTPTWLSTLTPKNGSNALSPFIRLS